MKKKIPYNSVINIHKKIIIFDIRKIKKKKKSTTIQLLIEMLNFS